MSLYIKLPVFPTMNNKHSPIFILALLVVLIPNLYSQTLNYGLDSCKRIVLLEDNCTGYEIVIGSGIYMENALFINTEIQSINRINLCTYHYVGHKIIEHGIKRTQRRGMSTILQYWEGHCNRLKKEKFFEIYPQHTPKYDLTFIDESNQLVEDYHFQFMVYPSNVPVDVLEYLLTRHFIYHWNKLVDSTISSYSLANI